MNETIRVSLAADATALVGGFNSAVQSVGTFKTAIDNVGAPLRKLDRELKNIGRGLAGFGVAVGAGMGLMAREAGQFEARMRNVNTIMKGGEAGFRRTSAQILDMSRSIKGVNFNTIAEGLYDIASSGFQGAEALTVLEAATKASVGGLTSVQTAAQGATAILNAYGKGAENAAYISDVMFKTVELGVITFEELANTTGDWAAMAASAGVRIEEASAAMATMTLSGINANEAATSLNRTMQSFISPSEKMVQTVRALGHESALTMVQELGLAGAIEELNRATGGQISELDELFPEIRALRGVLALTAGGGQNYANVLAQMGDATAVAGAATRAYQENAKSLPVLTETMTNSFAAFRVEIGQYLVPPLAYLTERLTALFDMLGNLPGPIKALIAYGGALTAAMTLLSGVMLMTAFRFKLVQIAARQMGLTAMLTAGQLANLGTFAQLTSLKILGMSRAGQVAWKAFGLLRIGLRAMIPVLGGALIAWELLRGAQDRAARAADEAAQALVGGAGMSNNLDTVKAKLGELNVEIERTMSAANQEIPYLTDIGAGIRDLPVIGGLFSNNAKNINIAAEAHKAYNEQAEILAKRQDNIENNILKISEAFGITQGQAQKLADTLEVDLGKSWNEIEADVKTAAKEFGHAKVISGDLGAQLRLFAGDAADAAVATESMTDAQKGLASALRSIGNPLTEWGNLLSEKQQVAQDFADAQYEAGIGGSAYWEEFVASVQLSLGEYERSLEQTNQKIMNWQSNLANLAGRGVSEEVLGYLASLGNEGIPLIEALANGTKTELDSMVSDIETNMRLTSDKTAVEMQAAFRIAETAARSGSRDVISAITSTMGIGLNEIVKISQQYGLAIVSGINPILIGLGKQPIHLTSSGTPYAPGNYSGYTPPGYTPAPGGIGPPAPNSVLRRADGGVENHNAEIAPAGAWRVWAEPETGGEAYIPLSPSKRSRSVAIWEETGRLLGQFASGGFASVGNIPRPGRVTGALGAPAGAGMDRIYGEAAEFVARQAAVAAGEEISGGWQSMWAAVNRAFPGARLHSGYRPGAITATGRPSYHGLGRAVDLTPSMAIAEWIRANYMGKTKELIFSPFGSKQIHNGRDHVYTGITKAMHYDHVHWAMREGGILNPHVRDKGGPLMPGFTYNGTGRPETVIPFANGGILDAPWDARRSQGHSRRDAERDQRIADDRRREAEEAQRAAEEAQRKAEQAMNEYMERLRNMHTLGLITNKEFITALNARLAAETEFSSEWMALYRERQAILDEEARRSVIMAQNQADMEGQGLQHRLNVLRFFLKGLENEGKMFTEEWRAIWDEIADIEEDAADRRMAAEDNMARQGRMSNDEYRNILLKRFEDARRLYGYWSDEAQAIYDQIVELDNQAINEAHRLQDNLHSIGAISNEEYMRILHERLATLERYSDEWFSVMDEISRREHDAWQKIEDAAREIVSSLADAYITATNSVRQQGEAAVGQLASIYERAQKKFEEAGKAYEDAIKDRNDRIATNLEELHERVRKPTEQVADLLKHFGGRKAAISGDEIVAMLDHRVEAARRYATAMAALEGRGFSDQFMTRLAEAGPDEALHLVEALNSIDPKVVEAAERELAGIGGNLADVFVNRNRTAITAKVVAETPLPAMKEFNQLLQEEIELERTAARERQEAERWANSMAHILGPQLNLSWKTFNEFLQEEIQKQGEAAALRTSAEEWARRMFQTVNPSLAASYDSVTSSISRMIAELERQRALSNSPVTGPPPAPGSSGGGGGQRPMNMVNGVLIDPSTGRPAYTGPNGEGGWGGSSKPAPNAQRWTMPDGRSAWYVPGQNVSSGNQQALGMRSYDKGGYLPVGYSIAYNGTGRPEPVGHDLRGVTIHSGAVQISVSSSGGDTAAMRMAVRRGAEEGLTAVVSMLRSGVR